MFKNYPDVVTVTQLCEMLGIGKNTAYEILRNGKIKSIKIGKIYKIPKKFVVQYLDSNTNLLYNVNKIKDETAERSTK